MPLVDVPTAIYESPVFAESSDAQREDAAIVLRDQCEITDDVLILKPTRAPFDAPESRKWMEQNRPHLLPPRFERSLADRSFLDGNITARGQLVREVGSAEADKIAQSYGLKNVGDTRRGARPEGASSDDKPKSGDSARNPWSNDPRWLDARGRYNARAMGEQSRITKVMGLDKASALARAAGSFVGATKPRAA